MSAATMLDVKKYFKTNDPQRDETLKGFTAEWNALTTEDKTQIREGIGDGTYDYTVR